MHCFLSCPVFCNHVSAKHFCSQVLLRVIEGNRLGLRLQTARLAFDHNWPLHLASGLPLLSWKQISPAFSSSLSYFLHVINLQMQRHSGGYHDLPSGGIEDTVTVLRPCPQTRLPGPAGNLKWHRHWGYPTRGCYTRVTAGPTVRCFFLVNAVFSQATMLYQYLTTCRQKGNVSLLTAAGLCCYQRHTVGQA